MGAETGSSRNGLMAAGLTGGYLKIKTGREVAAGERREHQEIL